MPTYQLDLRLLPEAFAVCRLPADAPLPTWAAGEFISLTRTASELSVVTREGSVPQGVRCERGWRCLVVLGTLDFELVGVLASLLVPLAAAGVGVFCVSTFDTDYVLTKGADLGRALRALEGAGHRVEVGGHC